jgi:hypothetical protein
MSARSRPYSVTHWPEPQLPVLKDDVFPKSRFWCVLEEQPSYLVPPHLLFSNMQADTRDELIVNPHCWFSHCGSPPPDVTASLQLTDKFAESGEMVWVRDPGMGTLSPFWVAKEHYAWLWAARPGRPEPAGLPAHFRALLMAAHILVPPHYAEERSGDWAATVARLIPQFRRGYVALRYLVHPFLLGAMRRYYRYQIRTGAFKLGDGQSARRYAAHNESVARFFLFQLGSMVGAIAETAVKPAYTYFASYQGGAELPKHLDRPQCEFSVTLLVDATPEPQRESLWPICLETQDGTVTVHQAIGDGLLYRGTQVPHYRHRLPEKMTSTSIFFHYVPESFSGRLD